MAGASGSPRDVSCAAANAAASSPSAATPAAAPAGDAEPGPDRLARGLGLAALLVAGFAAIAVRRSGWCVASAVLLTLLAVLTVWRLLAPESPPVPTA